jgi:DNA-binding SARP family transcriptional activator
MLALYRSGRQVEALRAFQRTRAVLVEELGIEPSPLLRQLEEQILVQDPALDLASKANGDS